MPVYLYKCPKCGYESEELVLNKDDNKVGKCPKCGKANLEKQPTTSSIKGGSACQSCVRDCSSCK